MRCNGKYESQVAIWKSFRKAQKDLVGEESPQIKPRLWHGEQENPFDSKKRPEYHWFWECEKRFFNPERVVENVRISKRELIEEFVDDPDLGNRRISLEDRIVINWMIGFLAKKAPELEGRWWDLYLSAGGINRSMPVVEDPEPTGMRFLPKIYGEETENPYEDPEWMMLWFLERYAFELSDAEIEVKGRMLVDLEECCKEILDAATAYPERIQAAFLEFKQKELDRRMMDEDPLLNVEIRESWTQGNISWARYLAMGVGSRC